MKKLLVFLLLLCALGTTFVFKPQNNPLLINDGLQKVCVVSDKKTENAQSVVCGDLVFNYYTPQAAAENLKTLQKDAKSVQYYLSCSVDDILKLLNASVVSRQNIDDLCVVCAYTAAFDKCIYVDGKKVNVQIAQKDGQVVAGFPSILTGF